MSCYLGIDASDADKHENILKWMYVILYHLCVRHVLDIDFDCSVQKVEKLKLEV